MLNWGEDFSDRHLGMRVSTRIVVVVVVVIVVVVVVVVVMVLE
jgi:hypothetical protein